MTGTVKYWTPVRGWGFIARKDGPDAWVHFTSINDGAKGEAKNLDEGEHVEFDLLDGPKGPQAVNVRRMK